MTHQERQLQLDALLTEVGPAAKPLTSKRSGGKPNAVEQEDNPFHDWYRFVLSYPPHLVRDYFQRFGLSAGATVLDPFCGTGTTVVEAQLNGLRGIGLEANPFPHFASLVKTSWDLPPDMLVEATQRIGSDVRKTLLRQGIDDNDVFTARSGLELWDIPDDAKKSF